MPDTPTTPIDRRTIGDYLDALGSSAPTPGGGSAAGIVGAIGASLGLMVIALTTPEDEEATAALATARGALEELRDRFTGLAEEDERVYSAYRSASTLPKGTPEEKSARRVAMQRALKDAATVPMQACEASVALAQALQPVRSYGNPHVLSDARIAAALAGSCFDASRINVEINLSMIRDEAWVDDASTRLAELADQCAMTSS